MLLRLLSGLLVHRMIPSNIVSLFRVFTLVVVAAMASPLLGAIGEFEPSTETFTVYSERLDQFFVANNIGSTSECIGSSYCCSRKEKGGRYDFCDRQEDLQRSS